MHFIIPQEQVSYSSHDNELLESQRSCAPPPPDSPVEEEETDGYETEAVPLPPPMELQNHVGLINQQQLSDKAPEVCHLNSLLINNCTLHLPDSPVEEKEADGYDTEKHPSSQTKVQR